MSTLDDQIRSQTEAFSADLTALVKQAALFAVRAALSNGHAPVKATAVSTARKGAAPASKGSAKSGGGAAKKAAAQPKASAKKPIRKLGAKRPPAELAKLVEKLGDFVERNPGLGMEAIGKALSTPTSELTLPVKKLLAAKRIRFEGQKRATKYFPR